MVSPTRLSVLWHKQVSQCHLPTTHRHINCSIPTAFAPARLLRSTDSMHRPKPAAMTIRTLIDFFHKFLI
jgi:hypothetical protein